MTLKNLACLEQNVGAVDRFIRITAGVALIALPAVFQWPAWSIAALAALGGSLVLEGIIRY